jgi:hypothetical protein
MKLVPGMAEDWGAGRVEEWERRMEDWKVGKPLIGLNLVS